MDLPIIINVKSENQDIDNQKHYFDLNLDIKIESETPHLDDYDWCIGDRTLCSSTTDTYRDAGDYHQLTQLLKQQCTKCDSFFDNRYTLLQHNLNHLKVFLDQCTFLLKYKCCICNIFYNTEEKLKEHTTVIHGSKYKMKTENNNHFQLSSLYENNFHEEKLQYSEDSITDSDNLMITKSHHKCIKCSKTFTYKTWFSHMREVHSSEKSICDICKKVFKCKRYLRRHILYQHGTEKPSWRFHKVAEKEIKCQKCPTVFINKNSLKTHMRNCHTEGVQCDICKSKLKSKSYLFSHMRRVHYDDGKEHKCEICGRKFKSPRYVKIHMKNKHKH